MLDISNMCHEDDRSQNQYDIVKSIILGFIGVCKRLILDFIMINNLQAEVNGLTNYVSDVRNIALVSKVINPALVV
jgi:hypothetical protein